MSECARVRALLDLERFAEAEREARVALGQDPDDAELHAMLAFSLIRQEKRKECLASAEAALGLAPDHAWAHRLKGHALLGLNRPTQAMEAFDTAVRLQPWAAEAFISRAYAHIGLARNAQQRRWGPGGETKKSRMLAGHAEADIAEALRLAPSSPDPHLAKGELALLRGDTNGAERAAAAALALDAERSEGHELLGRAAEGRGEYRDAGDHYVRAGRNDPTDRTPIERLRGLGTGKIAVPGILLYVALRTISAAGRSGDPAVWIVLAAITLTVVAVWRVREHRRRRRVRSELSDQAQRALVTDAATRKARRIGRR